MERSDGQMAYAEGGVEMFRHWPVRIGCGVNMLCVHGRADVSTGIEHYRLQAGAELLLFPGAILHLLEAGEDLAVRMFTFPDGLFHEAAIPFAGPASWASAVLWMDMAPDVCPGGIYGEIARRNFLQGFLVAMCRSMPQKTASAESFGREYIFHRFLSLVRQHCTERRDTAFYAGELCISHRYLRVVTAGLAPHKTPKQLIDEQLVAEIKALLYTSDLSVTQIADRFGFPDQSYLSRLFKRKTGFSPYDYRMRCRR